MKGVIPLETYFISDLHFGHLNCFKYDKRPFQTLEEQDEHIISKWNEQVGKYDCVWILGDVSWYNPQKTIEILMRLNGIKNLCIGNHDNKLIKDKDFRNQFNEITPYKELYLDKKTTLVLCHYPIPCFNKHLYGGYHFYGHVHNSLEDEITNKHKEMLIQELGKPCNMFNVGVMMPYINYQPQTFKHIIESSK